MANTILVKEIPESVMKEVSREQSVHKERTGAILNQSKAVIKMLRDYIRCRNLNNFKAD